MVVWSLLAWCGLLVVSPLGADSKPGLNIDSQVISFYFFVVSVLFLLSYVKMKNHFSHPMIHWVLLFIRIHEQRLQSQQSSTVEQESNTKTNTLMQTNHPTKYHNEKYHHQTNNSLHHYTQASKNMCNKSVQSYPSNCITDTNPYQLQTMDDFTWEKTKGE